MPHNTVNETREEISLTGLVPYTRYSVEVAAMNEEGEFGPYSPSITVETLEDSKVLLYFYCYCLQLATPPLIVPQKMVNYVLQN